MTTQNSKTNNSFSSLCPKILGGIGIVITLIWGVGSSFSFSQMHASLSGYTTTDFHYFLMDGLYFGFALLGILLSLILIFLGVVIAKISQRDR